MMLTPEQFASLLAISNPWPDEPLVEKCPHGWTVWDQKFAALLKEVPKPLVVEVGAWLGKTSKHLLDTFPGLTLIAIDTWQEHGVQHERAEVCFETWQANLWEHKIRAFPIRRRSEQGMIALHRAGISPDLVYIDAAHDFAQVYMDMAVAIACFPNAIICGDDYTHNGKNERMRVGEAVDAYCKKAHRTVTVDGRFWLLNK